MATPRKNPRYLAILTIASMSILVAGAVLRPNRGADGEESASAPVSGSPETGRLLSLTQRRSVDAVARVFADVAAQVEGRIFRLEGSPRSALAWSGGTAVTAPPSPDEEITGLRADALGWQVSSVTACPLSPIALAQVSLDNGVPLRPLRRFPSTSYPAGDWALTVWRDERGRMQYRGGQLLGVSTIQCGGSEVSAVALNTPIDPSMLGGGVFDLDEGLFGIIGLCDGEPVALGVESADSLLEAMNGPTHVLASRWGFRAEPADEAVRERLGVGADDAATPELPDLVVKQVWRGYPAHEAGLRPGMLIRRAGVDPFSLETPRGEDGRELPALEMQVWDWGRRRTITLRPRRHTEPRAGLRWPEAVEGLEIGQVVPGGAASQAGARSGDRLLAINGQRMADRDEAAEALDSYLEEPAYWTLERHGRVWGAWVENPAPEAEASPQTAAVEQQASAE